MKDSIKNRKKNLLALCLSVMMLSSVAAFASCTDDSTDSSSSSSSSVETTTEEKDLGLIKNAGFETFDEKNAINTSVTGWSRSTSSTSSGSGLSSKAASGIIDLSAEAWADLTGSLYTPTDAEDAKANWDKMTIKDKLAFYDKWKEENEGENISTSLDFYESFNIDSGDIPTVAHFKTHNDKSDTKVLMIHNENPEPTATGNKAIGTAQKYTSSSTVTVKAGTSAKFSVWVKTKDLMSSSTDGVAQEAVNKGAYISVTHSVGGKSLDAYRVENINTEAMGISDDDNNGWKQYTFLLKGSSFTDTTFSLELGLGQGGGTYRGEYVNGYAFFDDIECKVISNEQYAEEYADAIVHHTAGFANEGEEKVVNVYKNQSFDRFALDFYPSTNVDNVTLENITFSATSSKVGYDQSKEYTSKAGEDPAPWLGDGFDGSKDMTEVLPVSVRPNKEDANAPITNVYNKYFKEDTFLTDKPTLMLLSTNGVAYTAEMNTPFTIEQDGYLALSFYVKTSAMDGKTGAGVTLKAVDYDVTSSFTAIDTTTIEPVEIGGDKDAYDGWQQCFFFVKNETNADTDFKLTFNFGPTTVEKSVGASSYHYGFAAFTNLSVLKMTKEEYACAQSGTYTKLVSIVDDNDKEDVAESGFDSAKATPTTALEKGFAQPQNYTGVYGNSPYITGTGEKDADYGYAGLVSKKNFTDDNGYFKTAHNLLADNYASYAWVRELADGETNATTVWNTVFGDSSLPLLIWNDGSAAQLANAYGYIGKSANIAANSYASVSVRVRGNAKAYIRLVDTDAPNAQGTYNQTISIGGNLTYWYDDNGNIWTNDPLEKASVKAFQLQPNGLYKVNEGCKDIYDALVAAGTQNSYFANLKAYEKADNGDLLVAEGGASHDYNSQWNGEGKDGIAYYYNKDNQTYYADKAMKIPVVDLASVTALKPRYEAQAEKFLEATVTPTTNDWTYVTFYIHTGDSAKNYRLEVWNGYKDGDTIKPNGQNSYVVFDTDNPGTAEDNFTKLVGDTTYVDAAQEKFESVFSYFDTASYLRYNKSLDENGYGNLYEENYTPSASAKGYAYLKHVVEKEIGADTFTSDYTVLADFQYTEKTVVASEIEDDSEEDTSSEEDDSTDTNVWLLASSLAIAGVLILAIVSIVVRKIVVKARKNRALNGGKKKSKK